MIQRKWDVGELRDRKSFVTFVDTLNVSMFLLQKPFTTVKKDILSIKEPSKCLIDFDLLFIIQSHLLE